MGFTLTVIKSAAYFGVGSFSVALGWYIGARTAQTIETLIWKETDA